MKIKSLDNVYDQCESEGYLQEPEKADFEKAKSLLDNAVQDLETLKLTIPIMEKQKSFNLIWSNKYEILRQLIQATLLLKKVKSDNHQCLYAYICKKHDNWDIDWKTIETMRLLRNGIHYEGRPLNGEIWKEYKLKFEIYSNTFIKLLKEKLKDK